MAKQPKELILTAQNDYARLQEELESAIKTRDDLNRQLKNGRERLKRLEETKFPDKLAESFVKGKKRGNELKTIWIKHVDLAKDVNKEFSLDEYLKPLYALADNVEMFKLFINGTGWSTTIDVQIEPQDAESGNLTDWGEAIRDYREFELKTKGLDDEERGFKATQWFDENVAFSPLHDKTIKGRLNYTPAKAPYWQILAYGSSPLLSDRPGTYNPIPSTPTAFVEDAEREIEDLFITRMNAEREVYFQEEQELRNILKEYEEKRDEFSEEVKKLRTEVKYNKVIYDSFGEKKQFASQDLIAKALREVEKGRGTRLVNVARPETGESLLITLRKTEGTIEI